MTYYMISSRQVVLLSVLVGVILAASVIAAKLYVDQRELPTVIVDDGGECLRVINYRNGDGYSCPDQGVLLRRYKTEREPSAADAK